MASPPRGIAVVDIGYTNSKIALLDSGLKLVAEKRIASRHCEGPPYLHIDPEPVFDLARAVLPEFDAILPIDAIATSAHGAAMACIAGDGSLALPVMDYQAEPPAGIIARYREIEPPFSEAYCTLLPKALTHTLQLFWQEQALPEAFARVKWLMPFIQYAPFRLSGRVASEISGLSCQTGLMNVAAGGFSSLAKSRHWDRLMAPVVKAWETLGPLKADYRGGSFRGHGQVLAGVHDSSGNYLRYLAGGLGSFTLLSTGTWIIGFDTDAQIGSLDPARDTNTNTDVFGRNVCCCRFFGGKEFEVVAQGAPAEAASLETVGALVARGTFALASFTDSGGPLPGTGGKGRVDGPPASSAAERASLAALYCALMCNEQLDAIGSRAQIIVDGPFSQNKTFLALLAALRPRQAVSASLLRDGTEAGAAILGLLHASGGVLPSISIDLQRTRPAALPGLADYALTWRARSAGRGH